MSIQAQPGAEAQAATAPRGAVTPPGGGFLTSKVPQWIFTSEQFSEDTIMIVEEVEKYWYEKVLANVEALEHKAMVEVDGKEIPLMIKLLREGAELGMMGIDVPEDFGGLELDKITSGRLAEVTHGCSSAAVTFGAHAGIGTLPIVYFGNDDQKSRWLPKLASAELISCYCLTEPGSGSDALSGKTTATLSEDGTHYLLEGEKTWISNGSWADVGIVFARLNGEYSGFIVDLNQPGVTRGVEEKKMGIHGSSTTSLSFDNVKVPIGDMLGQPGDAPKIALNILYLGRMKLGLSCIGAAKYCVNQTVKFGKERKQFGQSVITFEMQKGKLADMVASTYAVDSLSYRVLGDIEAEVSQLEHGPGYAQRQIGVFRRFGFDTSCIKILGSETLMQVANHAVRMHGGYGFAEEYQVERVMRDNVVDTIFEGTNDVNRLVCYGDLTKNVYSGTINFREYLEKIHNKLRADKLAIAKGEGPLADELAWLTALKRLACYSLERVLIGVGKDVRVRQMPMAAMADLAMAVYAAESTVVRARLSLAQEGAYGERAGAVAAIARLVTYRAARRAWNIAREALTNVCLPGEVEPVLAAAHKLFEPASAPVDTFGLSNVIADYVIEQGKYPF